VSKPSGLKKKISPEQSALPGSLQRKAREATEDYLETINSLIKEKGFAASVDIAERMNVSKPTVTSIVKKLDKEGYLVHEKYRGLTLTEKGKKLAEEMKQRHELIAKFLSLFGIDEEMARQEAERIEHGLHAETLEKLEAFTKFVIANPQVIEKYRSFYSREARVLKAAPSSQS
jgi:Mn-dependent DtxR family transcriptional regulator